MSQKFNAKNLAYDTKLPPFLAALRAQNPTSASAPDPLLAANRRHAKKRSGSEEAEDGPLVVDEGGNVLEGRVGGDGSLTFEGGAGAGEGEGDEKEEGSKEKPVSIGKKRKARVVGAGQEDEPEISKGDRDAKVKEDKDKPEKSSEPKPPSKKKKAKKIKLSFDDEDT